MHNNPLTVPLKTPEQEAAEQLILNMRRSRDVIVREWVANILNFWTHPNPQGICDALTQMGIRVDLVFNESAKLAEYIVGVAQRSGDMELIAKVQETLSKVLPTTFDPETGAATIQFPTPPEEPVQPQPEPENNPDPTPEPFPLQTAKKKNKK